MPSKYFNFFYLKKNVAFFLRIFKLTWVLCTSISHRRGPYSIYIDTNTRDYVCLKQHIFSNMFTGNNQLHTAQPNITLGSIL